MDKDILKKIQENLQKINKLNETIEQKQQNLNEEKEDVLENSLKNKLQEISYHLQNDLLTISTMFLKENEIEQAKKSKENKTMNLTFENNSETIGKKNQPSIVSLNQPNSMKKSISTDDLTKSKTKIKRSVSTEFESNNNLNDNSRKANTPTNEIKKIPFQLNFGAGMYRRSPSPSNRNENKEELKKKENPYEPKPYSLSDLMRIKLEMKKDLTDDNFQKDMNKLKELLEQQKKRMEKDKYYSTRIPSIEKEKEKQRDRNKTIVERINIETKKERERRERIQRRNVNLQEKKD